MLLEEKTEDEIVELIKQLNDSGVDVVTRHGEFPAKNKEARQ